MTDPQTAPAQPPEPDAASKEQEIFQIRLQKAEALRQKGINPYGNGLMPRHEAGQIQKAHAGDDAAALEQKAQTYQIAGRVMAFKTFGKLTFLLLRDRTGELQAMLRKNAVGEQAWEVLSKHTDVGDIVAVEGKAIRTKTGELSIDVATFTFLTKSLRPLPEKWHGLADIETRHRQRYVDLISTYPGVQEIFRKRTKIIRGIQTFLDGRDFIEVETPILHKPEEAGGAAAKPFPTHHNALDLGLKLRIATELHLKRLVVGGFERVYEIGRIFRNEGIDRRHNPEFTTVEFYWAYATCEDLIGLTEELLVSLAERVLGKPEIAFQGQAISLARPFPRVSMVDAVAAELQRQGKIDSVARDDLYGKHAPALVSEAHRVSGKKPESTGEAIAVLFEHLVEAQLPKDRPSFVVDFPIEVSPLARRRDADPRLTDRFELYVAGMEVANAFSELNDPLDQRQRFEKQVERQKKGDDEAMPYDHDFVRALEFGMPPTAGEGIGVDRLVMLFCDQPNIREVILFPLLKPLSAPAPKSQG